MPQGLEVRDTNGVIVMDTSTRVGKFLGIITGGTNANNSKSGSVTVPTSRVPSGAQLYYITTSQFSTQSGWEYNKVTITGNVIKYTNLVGVLYYGVY